MKTLQIILIILFSLYINQIFAQDGKCIEGDCKNGTGVYLWENGIRYEGTFLKSNMEGEGTYYWPNGTTHKGTWKAGRQHGEGIYTTADGRQKIGVWEYGTFIKRTDAAPAKVSSTNVTMKQPKNFKTGCVSGNCKNGVGTFVWEGQGWYEGNFTNYKKNGYGVFYWLDKSKYIGEWQNDERHGKGIYQFPNLTTKGGTWMNGQLTQENKNMVIPSDAVIRQKTLGLEVAENTSSSREEPPTKGNGKSENKRSAATKSFADSRSMADLVGPELVITDPEPNNNIEIIANDRNFTVKGYVADPAKVMGLWINDKKAQLEKRGEKHTAFEVEVEMTPGTEQLIIEAVDGEFNKSKEVYAFHLGNQSAADRSTTDKLNKLQRTALVIGNSDYTSAPLKNAVNDAKAITKSLEALGFEVFKYTDLDHQSMENAINEFGKLMDKRGGVGLFYFAGHGVQSNGENYLIPVKANIQSEKDIKYKSVNLGYMLDEFEGRKSDMNIVILDACRNNPFSRYRSITNGLAPAAIAPSGTFIAYSTSPGSVASDGDGENGLYTQELIKHINTKGKTIEQVFKKVRSNVRQLSAGAQIPWENSSIEGDFFFAPTNR